MVTLNLILTLGVLAFFDWLERPEQL